MLDIQLFRLIPSTNDDAWGQQLKRSFVREANLFKSFFPILEVLRRLRESVRITRKYPEIVFNAPSTRSALFASFAQKKNPRGFGLQSFLRLRLSYLEISVHYFLFSVEELRSFDNVEEIKPKDPERRDHCNSSTRTRRRLVEIYSLTLDGVT